MKDIKDNDNNTITIFIPMQIKKRGTAAMVILPKGAPEKETYYNKPLIKAISRAYKWKHLIETGKYKTIHEISKKEKRNATYVKRIYRLNYLAPDIVDAVLSGRQPRSFLLRDLSIPIPELWEEQRRSYGFVS